MFLRILVLAIVVATFGGCTKEAGKPAEVRLVPLTPELAKAALIALSHSGNMELRVAGPAEELQQMEMKPVEDGWFNLGFHLRIHPANGAYVLNDYPEAIEGDQFCYSTYEGQFVRQGDSWVATEPVFKRTTMMVREVVDPEP